MLMRNGTLMYEGGGNMSNENVLGFLKIKPECPCREQFADQYSHCVEHSIILVEPMEVKQSYLHDNCKLYTGSTFLLEFLSTDRLKLINHTIL